MHLRRIHRTTLALAVLAVVASATAQTTAHAEPPARGGPWVLAEGQLSPLSLDVGRAGGVYFSQNFAGVLMRKPPGKPARPVWSSNDGSEVGAVSLRHGRVRFATTAESGETVLWQRTARGVVTRVAGLSDFEEQENPDGDQHYAFSDLPADCEAQLPDFAQPYTGIVESHPYATVSRGSTTYVADAAGNTILAVRGDSVRALAVLPPQPLTLTAEAAEANGLPACVAGHDFAFEAVPTDVEIGPDGMLYVTTLPGGPEDPSLGARAAVHRIDPRTGALRTVADGLLTATGVAVADNGDIYVAELFGDRISRIPAGNSSPRPWRTLTQPGDVSWRNGRVWATGNVLSGLSGEPGDAPQGTVVRFPR